MNNGNFVYENKSGKEETCRGKWSPALLTYFCWNFMLEDADMHYKRKCKY